MKDFIKLVFGKKSAFSIALFFSIAVITGCLSASEEKTVNSDSNATAQNKPATGERGHAENQANENKNPAKTPQETLIAIYDGRNFDERKTEKEATPADVTFVSNEFKNKEEVIKQKIGENYCSEPAEAETTIYNSIEGAFTKPDSRQKAYIYSICELGRGFGIGGILIAENNVVVAHYVGQIGWSAHLSTLPDINKDGISEILYADGGSGQGYTSMMIEVLDFKNGDFKSLGETDTYSDNSGAVEDDLKGETFAYKISVQPAATPLFFRETYEKKGNAKNWSLAKQSEKISLGKNNLVKLFRID